MGQPLAGKRIGLVAGWASRRNGGVFEAMVGQAALIRDLGGEPSIFAARDEHSDADRARFGEAQVFYADPVGPAALAYAPALSDAMAMAKLDCLHLHGIWQGSSLVAAQWARANGRRYVISPHGMLDPWITGRSRTRKALFRWTVERANWRSARIFHALTRDEANDIRRWIPEAQVSVVPNPAPATCESRTSLPPPHAIYLGRIHVKKNVDGLLDAWTLLAERGELAADARLTIAGWGEPDAIDRLERRFASGVPQADFVGPVHGEAKTSLLRDARTLVLPSFSEGLPMAILEAWAAGTPTIQSEDCHLPEGVEAGAAIASSTEPDSIASALQRVLSRDERGWLAMSRAAQALAAGAFGRETIASRWAKVYSGLMDDQAHG